jgi:integrase
MILLTTNQPYSFKVWKGGIYMKKANPKELRQIFNKVCSLQWDLGKDESVQGRGLKVIEYFKEDTFINDIDENDIDGLVAHLRDKNLSNATINRYLSAFSTMITFCLRRWNVYKLERKPYITWLDEPSHELRYLSNEEEQTLISLFTEWGMEDERDFFLLLMDIGCRLSELQRLKVSQVFTDRITLYDTKNNEPRGVPLTVRGQGIVKRFCLGKRPEQRLFNDFPKWRPNSAWRRLRKAMGLLGDKRFTIHACRRTLVTKLLNSGVPQKFTQEWIGHKDPRMIGKYGRVLSVNLKQYVNVLEPTTGIEATDEDKPLSKTS